MITKEQIPAGWHQNMSVEEVSNALLGLIRKRIHMDFVVKLLSKSKESSVEWLVELSCAPGELPQIVERLLRLIPRIEGSLTRSQIQRLDSAAPHDGGAVRALVNGFKRDNNYVEPITPGLWLTEQYLLAAKKRIQKRLKGS